MTQLVNGSSSSIQWHKTPCYQQCPNPTLDWLASQGLVWIQPSHVLKNLGIPCAFQGSPKEMREVFMQRVARKIDKWTTKPLPLVARFQICTKVLEGTHVYYSSCSIHLKVAYKCLENLIRTFHGPTFDYGKCFHWIGWYICCTLRDLGNLGIIKTRIQGQVICAKWVV